VSIALYTKPYKHYKSGFEAIRAENKPKQPDNFDDFDFDNDAFQNFTQTITKKEFLQYDNKNKNGNRIQIYASEVGIKLLSESARWQSDGTFFCAPKPFKQAYYIMGGKQGEKMLPLVYILMQKKTFKAYDEVFEQLKRVAAKYSVSLAPTVALTDFEKAARKALRFHFPNITLKGCFFHFKQAIGRWIFKNGYKQTYTCNDEFKKWFRKLSCLAVVPLDKIDEAFESIKAESASISINVKPILNYFNRTWIQETHFPPKEWNQYGSMDDRTNNYVESYNNQVNIKLKTKPKFFRFVDFMKDEENRMQIAYLHSEKEPFYNTKQTKAVKTIFYL
jgi:hypothetical protein